MGAKKVKITILSRNDTWESDFPFTNVEQSFTIVACIPWVSCIRCFYCEMKKEQVEDRGLALREHAGETCT